MSKYDITLQHKDGTYKVAEFEAQPEQAPEWLAKYIFRHYPVSFTTINDQRVLVDTRTEKIVWRPGDAVIHLTEGAFHYQENTTEGETTYERWHKDLPSSKQRLVTTELDKAYDKGRKEGFEEGYAHALEVGKTQGSMDAGTHQEHHG